MCMAGNRSKRFAVRVTQRTGILAITMPNPLSPQRQMASQAPDSGFPPAPITTDKGLCGS